MKNKKALGNKKAGRVTVLLLCRMFTTRSRARETLEKVEGNEEMSELTLDQLVVAKISGLGRLIQHDASSMNSGRFMWAQARTLATTLEPSMETKPPRSMFH